MCDYWLNEAFLSSLLLSHWHKKKGGGEQGGKNIRDIIVVFLCIMHEYRHRRHLFVNRTSMSLYRLSRTILPVNQKSSTRNYAINTLEKGCLVVELQRGSMLRMSKINLWNMLIQKKIGSHKEAMQIL